MLPSVMRMHAPSALYIRGVAAVATTYRFALLDAELAAEACALIFFVWSVADPAAQTCVQFSQHRGFRQARRQFPNVQFELVRGQKAASTACV